MKCLIAVFTILFVSSIFALSAYGIETGVSDEVSATNAKDTTKSTGDTGLQRDKKNMTSEMMERSSQSAKIRESKETQRKKRQSRLIDSKETTNGTQTSTSNDLISDKNIKPNPVKQKPSPRPAPIGDRPQR